MFLQKCGKNEGESTILRLVVLFSIFLIYRVFAWHLFCWLCRWRCCIYFCYNFFIRDIINEMLPRKCTIIINLLCSLTTSEIRMFVTFLYQNQTILTQHRKHIFHCQSSSSINNNKCVCFRCRSSGVITYQCFFIVARMS